MSASGIHAPSSIGILRVDYPRSLVTSQEKHPFEHCQYPFSAPENLTSKYALFSGNQLTPLTWLQMFARSVARLPATAARRGFHTTPRQMGSPYHYPEGPRSNIPFNPMTRFFAVRYWSFMGTFAQRRETRIQEALDRATDKWDSSWLWRTFRHCR